MNGAGQRALLRRDQFRDRLAMPGGEVEAAEHELAVEGVAHG